MFLEKFSSFNCGVSFLSCTSVACCFTQKGLLSFETKFLLMNDDYHN